MAAYKVVICGGGNGAHCMAALASHNAPDAEITVLTIPAEVEKLKAGIAEAGGIRVYGNDGKDGEFDIRSAPHRVESDMAACVPDADMVILTLPAFVHGKILETMRPHCHPGMAIVGMPGQAAFEFVVKEKLGSELYDSISLLSTGSLPWACRIMEYGKEANVIGTKVKLSGGTVLPASVDSKKHPVEWLQKMLGDRPTLDFSFSLMSLSLLSLNAIVHPTILHGQWKDWDGTPVDENPLFYMGMSEETCARMETYVSEIHAVGHALGCSKLQTMLEVYLDFYGSQLQDTSSLFKAITTNKGYIGLTHPCNQTPDGKFVPNFEYRYLTEDIPNGLCVVKGFGEIAGVETPVIDTLLKWSQEKLNKEYLDSNGKMNGKDIGETRAPQKYGIKDKAALLACYHQ